MERNRIMAGQNHLFVSSLLIGGQNVSVDAETGKILEKFPGEAGRDTDPFEGQRRVTQCRVVSEAK